MLKVKEFFSPFHILLCSTTFSALQHPARQFLESILSRNCSALQHPVFSRNLFYPGTALLFRILSFPGIFLSRNCSALQHPIFSTNLFYPGTPLLCSILSFPEIFLSRNCSALLSCSVSILHSNSTVFSWNSLNLVHALVQAGLLFPLSLQQQQYCHESPF